MSEAYRRAHRLGERDRHEAVAASHSPYLHALDEMISASDVSGREALGIMEVPLDLVVGTKTNARRNAFSRNFMPLLDDNTEFASKWSRLYSIQVSEGFRDPVKVFEFMHRFYVQEGNKRVSVLKYVDSPTIQADVIRLLPSRWDGRESRLYGEFLKFWRAVPVYDVDFTREGSYRRLAAYYGRDLSQPWDEAAVDRLRADCQYFTTVYRQQGGSHLDITPADALLVYLSIYGEEPLISTPAQLLSQRIGKIWSELVLSTEDDKVAVVDEPTPADARAAGTAEERAEATPPAATPAGGGGAPDPQAQDQAPRVTIGPLALFPRRPRAGEGPLRVAFLYRGTLASSRWAVAHEVGRQELQRDYAPYVATSKYEGCDTDERVLSAIADAVSAGARVVFTTSPTQMDATLKASLEHPEVCFLNCSLNLPHQSVRSYRARTYEAKFLLGALAASVADNHKVGYRAAYPIYGSIADINAFAIGVTLVDPKAEVHLKWATREGSDWRRELADEGVTVLSGADYARPLSDDNKYGLYRMCDGVAQNLALPIMNWGRYYELIVQSLLQGTWEDVPKTSEVQAVSYWYGMSAGVIDVAISPDMPYYSRKMVEVLRNGIVTGTSGPFYGEMRRQGGEVIKGPGSPCLSSEEIVQMDWLNDNVVGSLPRADELTPSAREAVRVSGVIGQ